MEEVNTPRLPEINPGFRVGGITADREPPGRSWARIRTYLIDNPKDDDLKRRQEIWSYQQRNRGVVRSLMKALPSVPYRVKKPRMDKYKRTPREGYPELNHLGTDAEHGLRGIQLPRIGRARDSPMRKHILTHDIPLMERNESIDRNIPTNNQKLMLKYTSSNEVPVYEVFHPRFPRLSDSVLQGAQREKFLSSSKKVSFSLNDLTSIGRRVEVRGESASSSSGSSVLSDSVLGSYGPSSHHIGPDAPRSVWHYLNAHQLGDARMLGERPIGEHKSSRRLDNGQTHESKADKEWFEKVIGDKEVINTTNYDNFARTKPISDHFSPAPPPPRRLPPNELALLKHKAQSSGPSVSGINSTPPKKLLPQLVQSSPRTQIGQHIASKSPLISPTSTATFFPIFTRDGSPMRKIGGVKKQKLQNLAPVRPPPGLLPAKSNTAE